MADLSVLAPAPAGPRRSDTPQLPWHLRLVEQASAYLPLLLMALLALGTWWLVKNTPLPESERSTAPLRHEADYSMRNFMVQRFGANGAMRAQIEGDAMRHYPDTDTLEVDNARIRHIGADGRVTVASAQRALANGDASEVQLQGGAHVTREASRADAEPIEFDGEFLHAFLATERVRSHLPVTVTHGATRIQADAMEYDNLEQVVQLKGHVQASFPPAPPRSRK